MNQINWPTEQWETTSPETFGMDSKKLILMEEMILSRYRHINSIIIAKSGSIVFEKYFNGYTSDDTHNVASVAKSFISALIGITIDKGYIKSIDQKVVDFFPNYGNKSDNTLKKSITLKHLLTMTAPTLLKSSASGNEALDRLRRQPDWCHFILDQLGKTRKPEKFYYSTSNTHLLSAIITLTTGLSAREFANINLFKPIGIKEIPKREMKSFAIDEVYGKNVLGWITDPQGNTTGGWGLTITPEDMARFGLLYLKKGLWEDRQIISENWIDLSTRSNSGDYGYLWWLIKEKDNNIHAALGTGGNGIWCIPEKDLVVAVTAKLVRRPPDFLDIIRRFIL